MGLENPLHIAIVLVVVLLVFGAKRLPEMGKGLGEGMRGFKESLSGESRVHQIAADAGDERDESPAATVHVESDREPVGAAR